MKNIVIKSRYLLSSQTAKDTYWVFAGNVFTAFLAFVYTIFLARVFTPSDFGIFSAVVAFILLISDIADLGISSALSRFLPPLYSQKKNKEANSFIKTSFLFQFKAALLFTFLTLVFSQVLSIVLLKNKDFIHFFGVAALGILGTIILAYVAGVLSAQKKFREVAILNSLSTLVKVILIIGLFTIGKLTVFTTILVFIIAVLIAYAVSFRFLPLKFLKEKEEKGTLGKLLSFSLFLAVSRLFSAIGSRLDALMLIPLSSSFEAGIYSAANKIAFLYIMLASSFSMVIAPRLSSFVTLEEAVKYLKKVILAVVGILSTMVVMYFIAPWFVVFVLGKAYSQSVVVFQLLLIPMAFFTLTIPTVNFLLYTLKKPQISTFNTFIQLVIIFIGNLLLIPKYGRFGPIITLSFVYGFTFISSLSFSIYFFRRTKYG